MEQYSFLREMADSWGLLAMFAFFLGCCAWAFRPGARGTHEEVANSIFRGNDSAPVAEAPKQQSTEA